MDVLSTEFDGLLGWPCEILVESPEQWMSKKYWM